MMTNTKQATVRKFHSNLSKSSFFKLFVKFADLSQNCLSPWYRNLGNKSKNGGKKTKKISILLNFRKVACSFDRFPTIVVVGVEGNGWKDSCGEVGVTAARRV